MKWPAQSSPSSLELCPQKKQTPDTQGEGGDATQTLEKRHIKTQKKTQKKNANYMKIQFKISAGEDSGKVSPPLGFFFIL